MTRIRPLVTFAGLLLLWQLATLLLAPPPYILPGPDRVLLALWQRREALLEHSLVTATEIGLGFLIGLMLGCGFAALTLRFRILERWLFPLLIISQAIPVFALAPLLTLWFDFGMTAKIVMTVLIIFFPVASSFYDGLRRTDRGFLDLAHTMNARPLLLIRYIRLPAALPALASGAKIAAAVAPIGAIIGEWVGAGAGLGFFMLQANARMQTDLMFAALFLLALMGIGLFSLTAFLTRRALYWQTDSGAFAASASPPA